MAGRTCHVFAGTHKAGSTALQRFFAENASELADRGCSYARSGRWGDDHRALARALADGETATDGGVVADFAAELDAIRGDVVVASELFGDVIDKAPMPAALLRIVDRFDLRVRVVLFIRPQAPYFNSRYTQLVKQLRCDLDFETWVGTQLAVQRFDYAAHFGWMAADERFDFEAVPFDRHLRDGGIAQAALRLLGIDDWGVSAEDQGPNQIPGPKTIDYLLQVQRSQPEIAAMGRAERRVLAVEANTFAVEQGWNTGRFDGLTATVRDRIERHFAPSNEAFARAVWDRSWSEVFAD